MASFWLFIFNCHFYTVIFFLPPLNTWCAFSAFAIFLWTDSKKSLTNGRSCMKRLHNVTQISFLLRGQIMNKKNNITFKIKSLVIIKAAAKCRQYYSCIKKMEVEVKHYY